MNFQSRTPLISAEFEKQNNILVSIFDIVQLDIINMLATTGCLLNDLAAINKLRMS